VGVSAEDSPCSAARQAKPQPWAAAGSGRSTRALLKPPWLSAAAQMRENSSGSLRVCTMLWFTWLRKLYSRVKACTRCCAWWRSVTSQLIHTTMSWPASRAAWHSKRRRPTGV